MNKPWLLKPKPQQAKISPLMAKLRSENRMSRQGLALYEHLVNEWKSLSVSISNLVESGEE